MQLYISAPFISCNVTSTLLQQVPVSGVGTGIHGGHTATADWLSQWQWVPANQAMLLSMLSVVLCVSVADGQRVGFDRRLMLGHGKVTQTSPTQPHRSPQKPSTYPNRLKKAWCTSDQPSLETCLAKVWFSQYGANIEL